MNEDKKLKRAFVASAVALVAVGIMFVVTVCVSLSQLGKATDAQAIKYDMNCLTKPIEKPLTECEE